MKQVSKEEFKQYVKENRLQGYSNQMFESVDFFNGKEELMARIYVKSYQQDESYWIGKHEPCKEMGVILVGEQEEEFNRWLRENEEAEDGKNHDND